jgi:transposase
MNLKKRVVLRYSEAFKHQIIKEIEDGQSTLYQAQIKYGINGHHTIQQWMKRLGKLGAIPKIIRVEKPDEKDRIKELEAQIRQLKDSLAETQVRYLIAESRFEIVCEQQGLNPEEVKKKVIPKPLSKP